MLFGLGWGNGWSLELPTMERTSMRGGGQEAQQSYSSISNMTVRPGGNGWLAAEKSCLYSAFVFTGFSLEQISRVNPFPPPLTGALLRSFSLCTEYTLLSNSSVPPADWEGKDSKFPYFMTSLGLGAECPFHAPPFFLLCAYLKGFKIMWEVPKAINIKLWCGSGQEGSSVWSVTAPCVHAPVRFLLQCYCSHSCHKAQDGGALDKQSRLCPMLGTPSRGFVGGSWTHQRAERRLEDTGKAEVRLWSVCISWRQRGGLSTKCLHVTSVCSYTFWAVSFQNPISMKSNVRFGW